MLRRILQEDDLKQNRWEAVLRDDKSLEDPTQMLRRSLSTVLADADKMIQSKLAVDALIDDPKENGWDGECLKSWTIVSANLEMFLIGAIHKLS